MNGEKRTLDWAKATYGVGLEVKDGPAYHCILMQEREGPSSIDIYVYDELGEPEEGVSVDFMWPDGHDVKFTEPSGKAGFAYGPGSYVYDPAVGGPHWIVVADGNCDKVTKLGMLAGTNHRHLDLAYRFGELKQEEEPMPEYTFLKGMEALGIRYIDHRAEVLKMVVDEGLTLLERSRTDPIGAAKGIIAHHSTLYADKDPLPMDIAIYHIKTLKRPACAYTFIITKDGVVHFMMPIKYVGIHTGTTRVNYQALGVCFVGDFTKEQPTQEQLDAFQALTVALSWLFSGGWGCQRDLWIAPHKWINATQCPGQNLEKAILWY